jgi:hypothetical protein
LTFFYDISVETKSKGYYFETKCFGDFHVYMSCTNCDYTFKKATNYATGFWFSHEGETQLVNHTTNEICICKFYPLPSSFFANKESLHNRVAYILRDSNIMAKYVIKGCFFEDLAYFRVLNPQKVKSIEETLSKLNLGPKTLLWKKRLKFKVFCLFQLVIKIIFFQIY